MHADIAPNSDSTMRYSHPPASPSSTRSDRASTMWVCGEIGYAATTSGRHRATVSAMALEPSTCCRMAHSFRALGAEAEAVGGEQGVEVAGRPREPLEHRHLERG